MPSCVMVNKRGSSPSGDLLGGVEVWLCGKLGALELGTPDLKP